MVEQSKHEQLVGLYEHFLGSEKDYLSAIAEDAKRAQGGLNTGLILKNKSTKGDLYDFELCFPRFGITLLCARTGGGKTTALTDLTTRLCLRGHKGFFITLEEPAFAINAKMLASYSRRMNENHSMVAVNVHEAIDGIAGKKELEIFSEFRKDILRKVRVIDANTTVDITKITSPTVMYDPQYIADLIRYRNEKSSTPLDFVIIDFGQLMECHDEENTQVYMRLKKVMQAAKNLAGTLGIAVIMGAQLQRQVAALPIWEWEPEHIRDGSDIEQAASMVVAIGSDKNYPDQEYQSVIRLLKNRNGPKRVAGMFNIEFPYCYVPDKGLAPNDD
jgi:replicative DNA helicase